MKSSNIVILLLVIILILLLIHCFYNKNKLPIPNNGTINYNTENKNNVKPILKKNNIQNEYINNNNTLSDIELDSSPFDIFTDSDDEDEEITYNKKKYIKKSQNDILDQYNPEDLLPQEIDEDYFDLGALQSAETIKGAHLTHPKIHIGTNTVNASRRNPILDIRGEIHNPKKNVSPWMMSTIEPDLYSRKLC